MKKVDVLIVFEHRNRELESAIRICDILRKKGYTVEISQIGWKEAVSKFTISPKVLVVPWCYDNSDLNQWLNYKGQFPGKKIHIVNLHCEQLTFADALDFCLPKENAKLTYHCSWGKYFTDNMINDGVDKNLILETGSPRLEFFKSEYSSLTRKKIAVKYNLDINKKWILMVGNFSQMYMTEERIKELSGRGFHNIGENVELSKKTFYELVKWLETLCKSNDISQKTEIIYRPHPSESENKLLNKLEQQFPNFHIISDLPIREWYINCDIAFVWCSTSSVEAAYSKIPVFSLRPFEIPENKQIDLVEKLDQIKQYQDLENLIIKFLNGFNVETNEKFLNNIQYYYGERDADSCENTALAIERVINDKNNLLCSRKFYSCKAIVKYFNFYIKKFLRATHIMEKIKKWEIINRDIVSDREYNEILNKYKKL